MKKYKFLLLFLVFALFFLFSSTFVHGQTHLKLLAIEKAGEDLQGGLADLYLRLIPGSGDVYSATYPLTKIDTQISARFAKTIVCSELDGSCDNKDFLYTIKADSAIIGGPSAGAAFAVATLAELTGQDVNEKLSITGTINSGGLIGPVGGLKEKIDAANSINLSAVLIAKGSRFLDNKSVTKLYRNISDLNISQAVKNTSIIEEGNFFNITDNNTLDLVEYGRFIGIDVIEVSTLEEAMSYFTNTPYDKTIINLEIDENYNETMKKISLVLCNRSEKLKERVIEEYSDAFDKESEQDFSDALNHTEKAETFFSQGNYYSSASFCFSANVVFRNLLYQKLITSSNFINEAKEISRIQIKEKDYNTVRNLQTYIIVQERLDERNKLIDEARRLFSEHLKKEANITDAIYKLAFARERLYSALAWSTFFQIHIEDEEFSEEDLRSSCAEKLQEAQERMQYAEIFFPVALASTKKEMDQAVLNNKNKDYELCLFRSAKVKAESNVILSAMNVKREQLDILVKEKLEVAKKIISEQKNFPIMAYSYYQYANSLLETDPASALLYSEYALELANLEIYFKHKKEPKIVSKKALPKNALLLCFVLGFLAGAGLVLLLRFPKRKKQKQIPKKEQSKRQRKPSKKRRSRKSKRH
ncbi:hypothetical protein GF371_04245 [Candidatus Woesearchaeota archaeon]|nr:hypothetical protein [Candidatus Woesearchaeota archaeon]